MFGVAMRAVLGATSTAAASPPTPDFLGIGPDPEVVAALQQRTIPTQGTIGYVDNTASGGGDGTLNSPFNTIAAALSAQRRNVIIRGSADPNNPRRYFESNLKINYSGTASIPGRIMAFPDEYVVVDGRKAVADFTVFGNIGNTAWTQSGLSSADIDRGIWRSVGTFNVSSGDGAPNVTGWYEDHHPFRPGEKIWIWLVAVRSLDDLRLDGLQYFGPGLFHDPSDNRLYIRMARPDPFRKLTPTDLPSGPLVGGHPDPRQKRIHICRQHANHQAFEMRGPNWIFDGIGVEGYINGWRTFRSVRNVRYRGVRAYNIKRIVSVRDAWNGLLVEGCYFSLGFPWYTSWGETKSGRSTPLRWMQSGTALISRSSRTVNDVEIRHSDLSRAFDIITCTAQMNGLHVHQCNIESLDDLHHIADSSINIHVHNNLIMTNSYAGMNDGGPSTRTGSWWWHHNVIDWRLPQLWGRADGRAEALNKSVIALQSGHGNPSNRPIWFYHNTILMARQSDPLSKRWGVGTNPVTASLVSGTYYEPNSAFNNIIIMSDDPTSDADYMHRRRREHAQGSMHRQDGNIYGRPTVAAGGGSLTRNFYRDLPRTSDGSTTTFASLAVFKTSAHFEDTKANYSPGCDNGSKEVTGSMANILTTIFGHTLGDPGFWTHDYRPAPGGPAASGAVNITGFTSAGGPLPGMAQYQPWIGALPPRS